MSARIEVVRAVYLDGVVQPQGTVLAVSRGLAAELVSAGKARLVAAAPPPAPDPPPDPPRRPRRAEPPPDILTPET